MQIIYYRVKHFLQQEGLSMKVNTLKSGLIIAVVMYCGAWALQGTKGTPLGGMGTGYVVFDAVTGQMAAMTKVMPAGSVVESEFQNWQSSSCGLHFFVQGATPASQLKAKTTNENAAIFSRVSGTPKHW